MHVYLLENPVAGQGRARAFLDALTRALLTDGHEVTVYRGERPGDLARHVGTLGAGDLDVLAIAGGDGTLRSVLSGRPAPMPWPVAILPVGTANLVAREAGTYPLADPASTSRSLAEGRTWAVDLLDVRRPAGAKGPGSTEYAITNVSAGVDGAIVHAVATVRGRHGGKGGYDKWIGPILGVIRGPARPRIEVRVDDAPPVEGTNVVVQNAHCYGGLLQLAPNAALDSRRLEVVVFQADTARDLMRLGVRAALRSVHRDRQVRILSGTSVRLRALRPVAVQADGDPAGTTDLEVRLVPAALLLLRQERVAQRVSHSAFSS